MILSKKRHCRCRVMCASVVKSSRYTCANFAFVCEIDRVTVAAPAQRPSTIKIINCLRSATIVNRSRMNVCVNIRNWIWTSPVISIRTVRTIWCRNCWPSIREIVYQLLRLLIIHFLKRTCSVRFQVGCAVQILFLSKFYLTIFFRFLIHLKTNKKLSFVTHTIYRRKKICIHTQPHTRYIRKIN